MNAQEIRNAYIQFFKDHEHEVIARAPLQLKDDPTTLFTGSGMQPMIPYLLGMNHPQGTRIVDSQTCLRAQDIDEIGDNRHTTFFEMLGNWSLGDYFKAEQIPWMYEFLLDIVKLDINKIYATCFIGDDRFNIPRDSESAALLKKLFSDRGVEALEADINTEEEGYMRGIKPGERIFFYDGYNNWWWRGKGVAEMIDGEPGGPSSEMFYRFDDSEHTETEKKVYGKHCHPACDCGRFMEIGNNVFMEYVRHGEYFEKLPKRNVDHGSGLERIAAAALDDPDVFKISLMWPVVEKLEKISGKRYENNTNAMRVIVDHLRAATFLAVDGVVPSNKEQGYVMRRLLRRAIRFAFELGVEQNFMQEIVPVIAELYENDFPEVKQRKDEVIAVLVKEEKAFRQTLRKGINTLDKFIKQDSANDEKLKQVFLRDLQEDADLPRYVTDTIANLIFTMYDTYGYPQELTWEFLLIEGALLNTEDKRMIHQKLNELISEQRDRSRTAAKGTFKGGLGGQTLTHKKYHTATHLLQSALREIYGPELRQHGSNITEERLRFDFNLDHKMTSEEIARAETLVNGWIEADLPVGFKLYPTKEALDMGAIGPFGERYADEVKVYQMGNGNNIASLEICGGPHVDHTGQLGEDNKRFKIVKEEASSAGIRRIKAVLQ